MFAKVLVANRGEIAVRVFRACAELGIGTVGIYSDADRHAGHVRAADEAYHVGPAPARESYLDAEAILDVAARADVDAIHPGYGFLAENADFAERVESSPFTWIGPSSEVMERLGEKTGARRVMDGADVPVIPGTVEPVEDVEEVARLGEAYGYPIAVKAVGGGGGRGLKVVDSADGVADAFESARREGADYFDNPAVYVEKFLDDPKHIEVQVLADHHGNVRHLGERDCSLQRRHQKVTEEAPSPVLDETTRAEIGEAARRGIAAADYTNAGTVEFLVADDEFYFMEVNTRIQVEHCVTEAITGIDIVKWQLRIAMGEELTFEQEDLDVEGHAIEYRINAENPAASFAPNTGTLATYDPPGGIGVRVDDAVRQGDTIGGDYDSMIAKLIVHAPDREECLARSERALAEFEIEGIHTTIPFHRLMVTDAAFREGTHTTRYLDESLDPEELSAAVERWGPTSLEGIEADVAGRTYTVEVDGKRFEVRLEEPPGAGGGNRAPGTGSGADGSSRSGGGGATGTDAGSSADGMAAAAAEDGTVVAEMQGTILAVHVDEGDEVERGDVVCVLEAMKMENDVVAGRDGTVTEVAVETGDAVTTGDTIVVIE